MQSSAAIAVSIIHMGWCGVCKHDWWPTDEGLRKDFSWKFTPAIVEWRAGDLGEELVEVSHEQAEKIIQYFRGRWGRGSRLELDGLLLTVTQVPAERAGPHNRDEFIRSQSRDRKRRV